MKSTFRFIFLLLTLAFSVMAQAEVSQGHSNFGPGGVGVGDASSTGSYANTYLVCTGVTEVSQDVVLTSILTGTNGTTALADTAITTGLFVANPTGLSLSAGAVIFPAEVDTGIARIRIPVPWNYRSNGRLVLGIHTSTTISAGSISVTATGIFEPLNGLTNTTIVALTAVQLSTTAATGIMQFAFPVGLTLTPGGVLTYHVKKTGTGRGDTKTELVDAKFGFRPWGVLNGN